MTNKCVKFRLKIPNHLGKMSENLRVIFLLTLYIQLLVLVCWGSTMTATNPKDRIKFSIILQHLVEVVLNVNLLTCSWIFLSVAYLSRGIQFNRIA